jgi:hypothetical protein
MASTQNTLIVIGDTTIAANIKPALIAGLLECTRVSTVSLSTLLNDAIEGFMAGAGACCIKDGWYYVPGRPERKQRQRV